MNIEQIKQDLAAGVIVSPGTWRKLVEAALIQENALLKIFSKPKFDNECVEAIEALNKVEAL